MSNIFDWAILSTSSIEQSEHPQADKITKARLEAKAFFESYLHSLDSSVQRGGLGNGLGDKMDEDDRERVEEALEEGRSWLQSEGDSASPDEIKDKRKEVEGISAPIIAKYYEGGRGGGGGSYDEDEDEGEEEL